MKWLVPDEELSQRAMWARAGTPAILFDRAILDLAAARERLAELENCVRSQAEVIACMPTPDRPPCGKCRSCLAVRLAELEERLEGEVESHAATCREYAETATMLTRWAPWVARAGHASFGTEGTRACKAWMGKGDPCTCGADQVSAEAARVREG